MATKKTSAKVTSAKDDIKAAAKKIDKAQEKLIDAAEDEISTRFAEIKKNASQCWFAGLGVVGRSADIAQARYEKVNSESQAFINDLVERGDVVQSKVDVRLKKSKSAFETKFNLLKERISTVIDLPTHLKNVSDKLNSMSSKLEKTS